MSGTPTFAIVGAGLAGATAAGALRAEGFDGRVVLLGAEPHQPYQRPPLSKDYLQDHVDREKVFVHPPQWYAEHEVELRLATTVTALDRKAHELALDNGNRLRYDQLLLTTGAIPRRLTVPGSDLDGLHYLRSLPDSDRIKASLTVGGRVVIIGAGWIGLETAAAARATGAEVTVLERGELPLLDLLGPQVARVFADLHRDHGVDLRCKTTVTGIRPDGSTAGAVQLADGTELTAEVIIVGIGVTPNVELAQSGGLTVDNGILVDQHLRTSDPAITAAGDVANAYHPLLNRHIRVEHWANALHQPATAAATMLGRSATHDRLPYFYTDQYDLGMEYTGYTDPHGYDQVVIRGDLAARKFIAFWLSKRRVLAAMNVNIWDVTEPIKQLIHSGKRIDTTRLADPAVPLDALAQGGQT
jgi:3-phenylpropionate/trans-cinnamate dioxygenase ferredoxin reductase subunit